MAIRPDIIKKTDSALLCFIRNDVLSVQYFFYWRVNGFVRLATEPPSMKIFVMQRLLPPVVYTFMRLVIKPRLTL